MTSVVVVARIVARGAAQQQIVVRPDGGTVRSAGVQRHDPGVGGRIEAPALYRRRVVRGSITSNPPSQVMAPGRAARNCSRAGYWR